MSQYYKTIKESELEDNRMIYVKQSSFNKSLTESEAKKREKTIWRVRRDLCWTCSRDGKILSAFTMQQSHATTLTYVIAMSIKTWTIFFTLELKISHRKSIDIRTRIASTRATSQTMSVMCAMRFRKVHVDHEKRQKLKISWFIFERIVSNFFVFNCRS